MLPLEAREGRRSAWERMLHPWRRPTEVGCAQVTSELPAILDEGAVPSAGLVDHVEYCLSCQAELARYHKLLRLLHQLKANEITVPAGVVGDVLSSLEGAANRRAVRSILTGRPAAYGAAVLAAGGAAAGLVMLARARSRRPAEASGAQSASL